MAEDEDAVGADVVADLDVVPGQADHPLHVVHVRFLGDDEHHHVAPLGSRLADLVDVGRIGERDAQAVRHLVDEDEVSHQQGGDHRAGRDVEGLEDERAQEQRHQDGAADALGVFARGALAGEREVLIERGVETAARFQRGRPGAAALERLVHPAHAALHLLRGGVGDARPIAAQHPRRRPAHRPRLVARALAHAVRHRRADHGEHEHRGEDGQRVGIAAKLVGLFLRHDLLFV